MNKLKNFIVDPRGQWDHPGENTMIPNADGRITMKGVPYPVLGIDDTGHRQMMYPGQEYQFPGNGVYEIPMAQRGRQVKNKDYDMLGYTLHHPIGALKHFINPNKYHGTDEFKYPSHITFSDESKYSTPEHQGGHWEQDENGVWSFTPSQWNIQNAGGIENIQKYWNEAESQAGSRLIIPKEKNGGVFNPETDEFIGFSDELPQAQEGLEKKGFDSLSESQKALLQKGNNLDKVKGWYEKYPEEMQNYKAFIDQHNADDYLKLYNTEKEKFDESVKNNAEWHKDWYAKRAQLPQFKDVATQRLNNYTDENLQSVNLIDPVNFAFSRWKNQQKDMLGRVKKNSETGKYELLPIDADAPPSRFEFPTDKLFGEYEPNSKKILVNSKLVNQGYYDVNGKLHSQTVDHEYDHKQGDDYPQEGTTGHISEKSWKNYETDLLNSSKTPNAPYNVLYKEPIVEDPLQRVISYTDIQRDPRTWIKGDSRKNDVYQYEPTEVRARLDIWRQYNNIDALKDYSEDEIREIMQKNDKDPNLPRNIKELFETIKQDPSNLRFIHNNYVSNDKQSPLDKFLPQNDIPKAQKGIELKSSYLNTPVDRTVTDHSYYNPVANRIYSDPSDFREALPHEYYHAWQHEVGRDRLPQLYPGPLRQPQTPWEDELSAEYYNRRSNDERLITEGFLKRNPSFQFIPDDVVYSKYSNPVMYSNPRTLEGEARATESPEGRAWLKSQGLLPPGIERMYSPRTKKTGGVLHKFQVDGQYNQEYKPIEGTNRKVTPEGIKYPKGTNGIAYNVDIAPGVEIVDNMPDNLKGYETMLPIGSTEREGERTYDKFQDKYRYAKKNQSKRDTVIDLTNQRMAWFPFNVVPKEQYSTIIGNNYVEKAKDLTGFPSGNSEDYAKNWIKRMLDPEDTFRNKDYAEESKSYYRSKDIPAFYGIENGKFKVGNPKDFSESTMIVPVRNGITPYAKIEKENGIFNNKTYTYDKSGNKIWNLNSKDKFIVYSPKTKKAIFRAQLESGSVDESKKILEEFAKQNPDAYIIPMDEGRFASYQTNSEGLSEDDVKNWNTKAGTILLDYLTQTGNVPTKSPSGYGYGYNFGILKKEGGENLDKYQKKGQVNSYPSTAMTYNDNRSFYDSNAVIPGNKTENDPRYNDWVKKMVYEGKIAYDPTTGKSYPLNNKISVPEGRAERATAEYARKPVDERLRTNKDARKDAVMQSMIDVGNNPAFYAPGAIATGALASGYLPAIGRGVIGGLSQSLPGMSGVAGATYGNLLGSYAATDALVNRIPQIPGQLSRGEYGDAAANAAMSGLDLYGANMISPLAKNAGKLFREQIYNAVDPVGYGVREKILRAPKTWARNTFYPNRRLEILQNDFNPWGLKEDKIRMAKNRLDSWRLGLGLDQKYDTFRYAGDNTYAIKNMKPRTGSFADLYSDILANEVAKRGFIYGDDALVNIARRNELAKAKSSLGPASFKDYYSRLTRNQQNAPWKQMRIVEPAKNSKFTHSVYDNDFDQGIMGNYRWDVNKLDDGNIHFQSNDTWDINPWEKRGSVNLDNTTPSPGYRKWNPFSNLEFLKAVGGKPFNIQNNFTIDPKTFEIIDSFKKGGSFNPNTDEFLGFVD